MTAPALVAVSASSRVEDGVSRLRLNEAYLRAVERAGALPVVIPPVRRAADVARFLDGVDALLLTGGEDVAPARYGAAPHPKTGAPHPARDATEIALVEAARERRLPTLAICRGIQLLNVALGGTLVQDIPSECPNALDHDPPTPRDARVHTVTIERGSRLASLIGTDEIRVNSFHHQSVAHVAPSLAITARSPDGIIEAVEWSTPDWLVVGVQWHPEELDGADIGIFRLLSSGK
jgi:putative glutamine amidotransferase